MRYTVYYPRIDKPRDLEKDYYEAGHFEAMNEVEALRIATCKLMWITDMRNMRFMRHGDIIRIGEGGDRFKFVKEGGPFLLIDEDEECKVEKVIDYGKMNLLIQSQYDP